MSQTSQIPENTDIIIRMSRCHFIDLLDKLEHYDFDFVDLSAFKNYIFMAPLNEYKYMIHSISNTKETYTLHYCKKHKNKAKDPQENIKETIIDEQDTDVILENIPYGLFSSANLYDLEINLTKKTLLLINEYVVIDMNDIIEKINVKYVDKKPNKRTRNKILHLLGC